MDYNQHYLNLNLPFSDLNKDLYLGKVLPNAYSLILAEISKTYSGLLVVLVEDFNIAHALEEQLINFVSKEQILHFPDWETLPFDNISPHPDLISARLATLYKLPTVTQGILIVPMITLMHRICPLEYIKQQVLLIDLNTTIELEQFIFELTQIGYIRVTQVMNYGEYAIRGSIIDLFPSGSQFPYRIDLLDNKVDSIRTFNIENQRTRTTIEQIKILPAQEYPFDKAAIKKFRENWRLQFPNNFNNSRIYQDVSNGFKSPGLEYYLPLFFDNTGSLFDFLPKNCLIVRTKNCVKAAEDFFVATQNRAEQYQQDKSCSILKVEQLFFNCTEIFSLLKNFTQVICTEDLYQKSSKYTYNLAINHLPEQIEDLLFNDSIKKLFCVTSKGRKEILKQIFSKKYPNLKLTEVEKFDNLIIDIPNNGIIVSAIEKGFYLNKINLAIITETDLFPNRTQVTTRRKNKIIDPELSIRNLMEINVGDPIVHFEYGVGRYLGLTQLNYGSTKNEFLVIEYAEHNKLYVPITNLNLIHRYSGVDLANAPLHKLGNDKWVKEKQKASKQIKDIAAQLLEIYAIRSNKKRTKYHFYEDSYQKFVDLFAFIDTPDQHKASLDIIADLTNNKPMDRVICGDVGFGKTEIAMRAAFIAAENSYQIAVLAPTTLLAQQHYQTFLDRFADFPIRIELLSRFTDLKKQKEIIEQINKGSCDIIIGTHRLLQKDLKFKKLGLLIIDEEHRFGVEQKEIFKKLRANVDILALTATPIPRTLNMAMSGIRDLSIIATPPNNRLAVKTFIREYSLKIIKEAILRELQRGGQVYYVHNDIESIQATAIKIQNLIPQAIIKFAHGQMLKKELENVMVEFYHRKFNVLVCTTIIENGIDVPNANTIIINRADCFGLSQLHQLRGRVGRSNHQAYAFCFTPNRSNLTQDAIKRLEALENLDTLGIGFTLATHDLEIRGSGELLGNEQSGNMQTIGFSLYMELLEHAVTYLKENKDLDDLEVTLEKSIIPQQVEIDLQIPALIPSEYIPDVHTRLVLYKKLSKARTEHRLQELMIEFIDRFGLLPLELKNLFALTKLKITAESLGVKQIKLIANGYTLEFKENHKIDFDKIISLLKQQPSKFKLSSNNTLNFLEKNNLEDRVSCIEKLLLELMVK